MKKILAVLLAVALVATLAVSAVMTASAGEALPGAELVVSTATAKKGETKDITISMVNNPGIASLKLSVTFPSDLTLNSVTYNDAGLGGQSQAPAKLTSPATLNWFNGGANTNGDMVYATLNFTVASNATEGDKAITISYNQDDVYNINEDDVVFDIENGKITVVSCLHESTTQVPAVASTCKTAGHGAYTKCNECGAVIEGSDAALDLDPANHEGGTEVKNAKPATCSEEGYTGDTVCKGCGATLTAGQSIKKTDHTPGDWHCDYGAHWKECTVCKQVIGESEHHDFEEKVLEEPTTEKEGKKANVCKVCGYVDEESVAVIDKLISYDVEQTEGKTEESAAVFDGEDAKKVGYTAQFGKAKLTAVRVDGKEVAADKYEVTEDGQGNVIVTFTEDYLKTLENGNHTVTIVADDGIAQSALTVKNNAAASSEDATTDAPKTGDMDIALLIFALIAMIGACAYAGVIYRRKIENR